MITHILRSPTVKINLSSDPTQPHPLASLRAAPVLADAAGRRTASRGEEGRSAVLHHQTGLLQQNNTLQEKRKERKKKKKDAFWRARQREAAITPCFITQITRQDGGEHTPRSNLCPDAEGWEEGTKDKGRHRHDLW